MAVVVDIAKIATALYTRLGETFAGLPVAYPEPQKAFVPPVDGDGEPLPYLRASILPNVPRWQGMRNESLAQGLLQVDIVWPRNQSELPAYRIAKQIGDHFLALDAYYSGGVRVTIAGAPYASPPLNEPSRLTIPVTIPWQAV